jgi:uncharacterized protein (DUF3820 family)
MSLSPDKVGKLCRVAFDHRTPEGEAVAALRAIRTGQLDWHEVMSAIVQSTGNALPKTARPSSRFRDPLMPFGKYRGELLSDIAENDRDYLLWVLAKCRNIGSTLRRQIQAAVDGL